MLCLVREQPTDGLVLVGLLQAQPAPPAAQNKVEAGTDS